MDNKNIDKLLNILKQQEIKMQILKGRIDANQDMIMTLLSRIEDINEKLGG